MELFLLFSNKLFDNPEINYRSYLTDIIEPILYTRDSSG